MTALMPTAPASAQAGGCSYSSGFTVPYLGVYIPRQGICVHTDGWGLNGQNFFGYANIEACNYKIQLRKYDSAGTLKWTSTGPMHYGCSYGLGLGSYTIASTTFYNGGKACAALFQGGAFTDQACIWTSK